MKKLIDIEQLIVGMFVESDVQSVRVDGEIRHFLVARDAVMGGVSNKRARLTRRKEDLEYPNFSLAVKGIRIQSAGENP